MWKNETSFEFISKRKSTKLQRCHWRIQPTYRNETDNLNSTFTETRLSYDGDTPPFQLISRSVRDKLQGHLQTAEIRRAV